ncbi:LuxR family transcriptional regulator [Arthrobacter sp. W4I7]|uniref:LuxR family transcriptional regulator n=1 Tax=Arthrobacter sp. W4I7 TaxID=3042296 RepID=UPI002781448C|nr:LuxR family transcriptional regulator [Arthrobacter sp. W4I7]MDQ0692955.1 cobalamin biosynthesis Mg chelatase CobN [Arthrobacter sp. W4I7]
MRKFLRIAFVALLLLVAPALSAGAAQAAPATYVHGITASSEGAWAQSAASPTPSPGDTASTGPANPGTGESAENESTRLDYTPWVIGGVVLLTLIVILIWRRRRNTTIV